MSSFVSLLGVNFCHLKCHHLTLFPGFVCFFWKICTLTYTEDQTFVFWIGFVCFFWKIGTLTYTEDQTFSGLCEKLHIVCAKRTHNPISQRTKSSVQFIAVTPHAVSYALIHRQEHGEPPRRSFSADLMSSCWKGNAGTNLSQTRCKTEISTRTHPTISSTIFDLRFTYDRHTKN